MLSKIFVIIMLLDYPILRMLQKGIPYEPGQLESREEWRRFIINLSMYNYQFFLCSRDDITDVARDDVDDDDNDVMKGAGDVKVNGEG